MSRAPYLSVVATSRNDDHGGGMLDRMQVFVNGWIEQCRRHALSSELLLVEWNPPAGREPLATALRWPADPGHCEVRIVTVPEPIHRRYRHSEALPLFQMIAKNVGIRRARGEFVLATNVDILFNDELFSFLAERRLESDCFYRIDRSDVMSDVPLEADIAEQFAYCRTHLLRVNQREATFPPPGAEADRDVGERTGDDFELAGGLGLDRRATGEAYLAACAEGTLVLRAPTPTQASVLRMVVEAGPRTERGALLLDVHDEHGRRLAHARFRSGDRLYVPLAVAGRAEIPLHLSIVPTSRRTNAPPLQMRLFDWGWASPAELDHEASARADAPLAEARAVAARDIHDQTEGVSLHDGWGERAFTADGQLYRRATNGASFSSYAPPRLPGRLVVDLEAASGSLVELAIAGDDGHAAALCTLAGRTRIPIPSREFGVGRRTTFTLRLVSPPGAQKAAAGVAVYGVRRAGVGPTLRHLLRPLARPRVDLLHTNGCGDFTLMRRDHWLRLRGYPEWEAYSMNIDGLTCYAAHAMGLREVVLRDPMRIYHIEHGLGSGWSPEGERKLYERITSRGITWIGKEKVLAYARRMYRRGPLICNDQGWGLGRESLAEVAPCRAAPGMAVAPTPAGSARTGG